MEKVRPWLDLIDALRADGVQQDLPLPQIAVMGTTNHEHIHHLAETGDCTGAAFADAGHAPRWLCACRWCR